MKIDARNSSSIERGGGGGINAIISPTSTWWERLMCDLLNKSNCGPQMAALEAI